MRWYIGCSGYYYKAWSGKFYPADVPRRLWLPYYAARLNTLEVNNTFYQFPTLEKTAGWYQATPPGYKVSVKIPRAITHFKQLNDTGKMLHDVYHAAKAGLQQKLGCMLFQLPGRLHYTPHLLQKIIDAMDRRYRNVLECRHPSWWIPEVFDILGKANIPFCSISHPGLPDNVIINTGTVYYRFHGVPQLYRSKYRVQQLQKVTNTILKSQHVTTAYIYFNNDITAAAIDNARQMMEMAGIAWQL